MDAIFDRDDVLRRLGGDRALFGELAGIFVTDAPGMLEAIAAAIAERDPDGLFRTAHKLKGSVANFSAHAAVAAALQLERIGGTATLEEIEAAFARVRVETERLRTVLAAVESGSDPPQGTITAPDRGT